MRQPQKNPNSKHTTNPNLNQETNSENHKRKRQETQNTKNQVTNETKHLKTQTQCKSTNTKIPKHSISQPVKHNPTPRKPQNINQTQT